VATAACSRGERWSHVHAPATTSAARPRTNAVRRATARLYLRVHRASGFEQTSRATSGAWGACLRAARGVHGEGPRRRMSTNTPESAAQREQREREVFRKIATEGRSATSDADLVVARRDEERLLSAVPGTADALEQMFAFAMPLEGARVLEICG